MDKHSAIFQPIQLGPITVKNRIEVSPATPFLSSQSNDFSIELREYVRNLAKSGAGIVNSGLTMCTELPRNELPVARTMTATRLYSPDLTEFAEICHRYGAKAGFEAGHAQFVMTPSHVTVNLPKEELRAVIAEIAGACGLAVRCGFDIICVHGGHGAIPSVFSSATLNQRTDEYGGSLENRCRFGIELLDAIRAAIGDKAAISYRISAEEMLPGRTTLEETIEYVKAIEDKIDLLHVSRGVIQVDELLPYLNAPPYLPRGLNLPYAKQIKQQVSIPVTVVNAFNLELAEEAVSNGDVDMVSMVRTIYADPRCVTKARKGKLDEVRPCVRCNNCIGRSHSKLIAARCAVNATLGRETHFPLKGRADSLKKVTVVGGGPAGLEAARTAAKMGHSVTLYEKSGELGGNLIYAAVAPFKYDMRKYLDWSIRMAERDPNITIKLNTEVTPDQVEVEAPDVVIVAVGSKPIIPTFSATGTPGLQWVGDVEMDNDLCGDDVIIVGAGFTGLEAALSLALAGRKVRIIDMIPPELVGADGVEISMIALRQELDKAGVEIECNLRLIDVTDEGAIVESTIDGARKTLSADTVILSLGVRSDNEEVYSFDDAAEDVFYVGDCMTIGGTLYDAVHTAFDTVMDLE
jgi:2,4-dienoyl-CoA reductase-like NADH-dependent reductase (Old Yellow Enzyme family)/thioredoxin reductase